MKPTGARDGPEEEQPNSQAVEVLETELDSREMFSQLLVLG